MMMMTPREQEITDSIKKLEKDMLQGKKAWLSCIILDCVTITFMIIFFIYFPEKTRSQSTLVFLSVILAVIGILEALRYDSIKQQRDKLNDEKKCIGIVMEHQHVLENIISPSARRTMLNMPLPSTFNASNAPNTSSPYFRFLELSPPSNMLDLSWSGNDVHEIIHLENVYLHHMWLAGEIDNDLTEKVTHLTKIRKNAGEIINVYEVIKALHKQRKCANRRCTAYADLDFTYFVHSNDSKKMDELTRLWNCDKIEFFCCECILEFSDDDANFNSMS